MPPTEVSAESPLTPLRDLKVLHRVVDELPVVNDVVDKYKGVISGNSTVQSATHAVQAGLKTFTDLKPVVAVKEAVLNSATMSSVVLPRVAGAVESLDSLACGQLDSLKAAVPAITEPTPQLLQTTKKAAGDYWAAAENYMASFTIAQVSLSLADRSLELAASLVGRVKPETKEESKTTSQETKEELEKATASLAERIYKNLGALQEYLRDLKKRGEPAANDLPVMVNQLAVRLVDLLRINSALGYLGLSLEAQEAKKNADEPAAGEKAAQSKTTLSASKRSAEVESSDED